jgi:hypothetical protein
MVRSMQIAAAHNVAGDETIRLAYHGIAFGCKSHLVCKYCNAKYLKNSGRSARNEKGRPLEGPPFHRRALKRAAGIG